MTKKLFFFIIGVLSLVTAACSSEDIGPQVPDNPVLSRATTPPTQSNTNPQLLTNWESLDAIVMYNPSGVCIKATPPWKSGTSTWLNSDFASDVKKEDGWVMLFHTFVDRYRDPNQTYMCFYNRFSGMIKIFYYVFEEDKGTRTVWDVRSADGKTAQAMFANYDYFSNPTNGNIKYATYAITLDNETDNETILHKGWNGFQFHLSEYRSQVASGSIKIGAYNTVYSDYKFNGITESTTTGTITTINGSVNTLTSNKDTKAALTGIGEGAEYLAKKIGPTLPKKSFLGINLSEVVSTISSGNVVSAVTKGLGFIFKSFIKPKTTVSEVSLRTEGTVKMEGEGKTYYVSGVEPITINLNEILTAGSTRSSENNFATLAVERSNNVELGIWNLKYTPTLYYSRYSKVENLAGIPGQAPTTFDVNGFVEQPDCYIGDVEIEFNPDIKPYITSWNIQTAILDVNGGNRSVSSSGKRFAINTDNKIATQDNVTIYGISSGQIQSLAGFIPDTGGASVDESTQLYYDWGTNVTGNRAVSVIVTWTVKYGSKTQSFTESRVYDVTYKISPTSPSMWVVNNPPSSYLLDESNFISYSGYKYNADEKYTLDTPTFTYSNGMEL
ncbi:MAG: hypothetical protein HDS72_08165 [Bacteroidales bacterium]|nr:hypothetical protein [Bacteroidales bacterium]